MPGRLTAAKAARVRFRARARLTGRAMRVTRLIRAGARPRRSVLAWSSLCGGGVLPYLGRFYLLYYYIIVFFFLLIFPLCFILAFSFFRKYTDDENAILQIIDGNILPAFSEKCSASKRQKKFLRSKESDLKVVSICFVLFVHFVCCCCCLLLLLLLLLLILIPSWFYWFF